MVRASFTTNGASAWNASVGDSGLRCGTDEHPSEWADGTICVGSVTGRCLASDAGGDVSLGFVVAVRAASRDRRQTVREAQTPRSCRAATEFAPKMAIRRNLGQRFPGQAMITSILVVPARAGAEAAWPNSE